MAQLEIVLPTKEQIEEKRAYELYLARGCEPGMDLEDWLAAEENLPFKTNSPRRCAQTKANPTDPEKSQGLADAQMRFFF